VGSLLSIWVVPRFFVPWIFQGAFFVFKRFYQVAFFDTFILEQQLRSFYRSAFHSCNEFSIFKSDHLSERILFNQKVLLEVEIWRNLKH